jgi:hypothetical protein
MTLFTFFIESPSTSKCPTIISSRSRGNNFSNTGETTKSQKEPVDGDTVLEQDVRRHYSDNGGVHRWVIN